MKKKIFTGIILLLAVFTALATCFAEDNGPMALDLVIVSDQSASMTGKTGNTASDKDGYRLDAAAIMIGMCDMDYSRAGAVMFYGNVYEDAYKGSKLNTMLRLDRAGRSIYQNMFVSGHDAKEWRTSRSGAYTDIEAALVKAIDMLSNLNETGNHKVILLLTDGGIEFEDRTKEEASRNRILDNLIPQANELGITIHTVYLFSDKSGDPYLLSEIAEGTGGTFSQVEKANDLPVAFNQIFAAQIGSEPITVSADAAKSDISRGPGYCCVPISIPNHSVKELNIIIPFGSTKNNVAGEILFCEPNSSNPLKNDNTKCLIVETEHFYTLKVVNPRCDEAAETSRISFPESMISDISLQYVYSYNVDLFASINKNSLPKNDDIVVEAVYYEGSEQSNDNLLYSSIPATVIVEKDTGNGNWKVVEQKTMNVDDSIPSRTKYTCTIQPKEEFDDNYSSGKYRVTVYADGAGLLRKTDTIPFVLTNEAPVVVESPALLSFIYGSQDGEDPTAEQSLFLYDYVVDPNEDTLTFEITTCDPALNARIQGNDTLIIEQKEQALQSNKAVEIMARDWEGESCILNIPVSVVNEQDKYANYGIKISLDNQEPSEENTYLLQKGQEYTARIRVIRENGPVDIYPETISLYKDDTELMLEKCDDFSYTATFTTDETASNYILNANCMFGDAQKGTPKVADPLTVQVQNHVPAAIEGSLQNDLDQWLENNGGNTLATILNHPGNVFWMDKGFMEGMSEGRTFDCAKYFTDEDAEGDILTYSAALNGEPLQINDGMITLDPALFTKEDTWNLVITCTDADQQTVETVGSFLTVSLANREKSNLIKLVIALIVLLIVITIVRQLLKPAWARNGAMKVLERGIGRGIEEDLPKGKKPIGIKAWIPQDSTFDSNEDYILLKPMSGNRIKVYIPKNNPPYTVVVENQEVTRKKSAIMMVGDTLELQDGSATVGFEYFIHDEDE